MSLPDELNKLAIHSIRKSFSAAGHLDDSPEHSEHVISSLTEQSDAVQPLRDELQAYITTHREHLSLSCNGICSEHDWAKVIQCHHRMKEGKLV